MPTREEALSLLYEWVKSESLRRHCFSVGLAMEKYAEKYINERKLPEDYGNNNELIKNKIDVNEDNDNINNSNKLISNISNNSINNQKTDNNQQIIDKWFVTGLLHDFDYEKYPDINLHPKKGCEELARAGYEEDIINAILGHNKMTGVERASKMAKTLFAVDELCGLIVALSYVRPMGFEGLNAKSVGKALKKKDFAAAINRDEIEQGIKELNVNREEHFSLVIEALKRLP